jgi:anaerobic magnesium-protoporphyrin IX monomethyl ester cyclase
MVTPPAGAAALLGYLKAHGITDFGFLDLRLSTPACYEATYAATGVFGESFVMDVPELPLILQLLSACDSNRSYQLEVDDLIERYCLERGISTHYLSSYVNGLNRYYEKAFAQYAEVDFVGFSVWTSNLLSTLLAAHHLKRRKRPPFIVAGGPQLTESPASAALALRGGLFDAVVRGEGEETLRELYTSFCANDRKRVEGIPGTQYIDSQSGRLHTMPTSLLKMGALPVPSFDEMAIDEYQIDDDRTLPFQLSRGCTDKCTFCSEWVFWERFRPGSANDSASGVEHLRSRYGATYIAFTDSLLNGNSNRLQGFAEELLRQETKVRWGGFMRADMDERLARLIHRAGCREAFVGVESFDDETLAAMNKRRTEADNQHALRAFLKAGIFVVAGLIPGFPGDSRRAFLHSVKQVNALQSEFPGQLRVNTEVFRVSPGLPLFRNLEGIGLTPQKWADDYLNIAPRYSDITSNIYCSVEGSNQGMERIGRERIAFMIRTDAPVRTDKFEYDEDERLAIHEFESRHIAGDWHMASTKLESGWTYALLVDADELAQLQELATKNATLAAYLRKLESRHIAYPSRERPPVAQTRFLRKFPNDEDVVVMISPFVVIRSTDQDILAVNYVNGRFVQLSTREGRVLKWLAKEPMRLPVSRKSMRDRLEKLYRFGIVAIPN